MRDFLWQHFRHRNRYPHQIMEDTSQYLSFKRLTSDVNDVIALTDDLRKRPMKFICINDETDFEKPEGTHSKITFHESCSNNKINPIRPIRQDRNNFTM